MALKFRQNQYNWLGHKLLVQHQYNDILRFRKYSENNQQFGGIARFCSEHMNYVYSIALVKTSNRLDEVIYTLQKLNFYKSNQYFLLLCQCLLYLGNHDSVIELCKQIIGKEIDLTSGEISNLSTSFDAASEETQLGDINSPIKSRATNWTFDSLSEESNEFKKLFLSVNRNKLINDSRLWFILGTCLEFQRQFKDADLAFRLAIKLSSAEFGRYQANENNDDACQQTNTCISNYYNPHVKYALMSLQQKANPKIALRTLNEACSLFAQNHTLNPLQALVTCAQTQSNSTNFDKAFEIISNLETQFVTSRNPAVTYNNLAAKFKSQSSIRTSIDDLYYGDACELGEEHRLNLNYLLARSHLMINKLVQDSDHSIEMYNINLGSQSNNSQAKSRGKQSVLVNQMDRLVDLLRSSDASCWSSASLWNNLGLCYLMKKRFIACLSCLLKAHHLNPLDWRINYNLALAHLHVNLSSRALICLYAAKNFHLLNSNKKTVDKLKVCDPFITTMMAICFDKLNQKDESRRYHVEATRPLRIERNQLVAGIPIISIINYLAYLHKNFNRQDDETNKLKGRLLDQLEHSWLQRSQNDPQFNVQIMELAKQIGEDLSKYQVSSSRKTYAWTKAIINN